VTDQQDPASPDEYILRRIPKDGGRYKPSQNEPVQRVAFEPSKWDVDGISVFRELFLSAADLASAGTNKNGYCVARLRVSDLLALGLTVVPDPRNDQPPGHAILPELSFSEHNRDRQKCKDIQHHLAKLAGRNIVFESG